jgi:hypothetical protein
MKKPNWQFTTNLDRLIFGMRGSGYRVGAPNERIGELDEKVVEGLRCRDCGAQKGSLQYEGFSKRGSYQAFSVCTECGKVREF